MVNEYDTLLVIDKLNIFLQVPLLLFMIIRWLRIVAPFLLFNYNLEKGEKEFSDWIKVTKKARTITGKM